MANTTALDWEKVGPYMEKMTSAATNIKALIDKAGKIIGDVNTGENADPVVASVAARYEAISQIVKDLPEAAEELSRSIKVKSEEIQQSNEETLKAIENA